MGYSPLVNLVFLTCLYLLTLVPYVGLTTRSILYRPLALRRSSKPITAYYLLTSIGLFLRLIFFYSLALWNNRYFSVAGAFVMDLWGLIPAFFMFAGIYVIIACWVPLFPAITYDLPNRSSSFFWTRARKIVAIILLVCFSLSVWILVDGITGSSDNVAVTVSAIVGGGLALIAAGWFSIHLVGLFQVAKRYRSDSGRRYVVICAWLLLSALVLLLCRGVIQITLLLLPGGAASPTPGHVWAIPTWVVGCFYGIFELGPIWCVVAALTFRSRMVAPRAAVKPATFAQAIRDDFEDGSAAGSAVSGQGPWDNSDERTPLVSGHGSTNTPPSDDEANGAPGSDNVNDFQSPFYADGATGGTNDPHGQYPASASYYDDGAAMFSGAGHRTHPMNSQGASVYDDYYCTQDAMDPHSAAASFYDDPSAGGGAVQGNSPVWGAGAQGIPISVEGSSASFDGGMSPHSGDLYGGGDSGSYASVASHLDPFSVGSHSDAAGSAPYVDSTKVMYF